jgi:hypothetical protein
MSQLHFFLLLLAGLSGACRTTPPKFESCATLGSARSDDPSLARKLALTGDEAAALICSSLNVEPEPPFVIWHMPEMKAAGLLVERDLADKILGRWVEIGDVMAREQTRFAVAHELVHWYARGTWDRLPHAVEEGLADELGLEFAPEWRDIREAELAHRLASMTQQRRARTFEVTERTFDGASEEIRLDAYAVGFEIVHRIGIDGLRLFCERAAVENLKRVPSEWLGEPRSSRWKPVDPAAAGENPAHNSPQWKVRIPLKSNSP